MMKEWKLSSFDLFSLNMTIKGAWLYESAPDFSRMQEALCELGKMYPHLGGRYHEDSKSLVWDDADEVRLPFETCDLTELSVSDLAGNTKVWYLVEQYDLKSFKEGIICPFSAVLGKLKNGGAVLFVQCAHATMDGASFYRLIAQWASLYKGEAVAKMTVDQSLIPAPDSLTKEETIRQAEEKGWLKIGGKQLIKMLWNLAINNSVKRPFIMEVSQEEITSLREKSGAGTNAVLSAVTTRAFAEKLGKEKNFKLLFVADLRNRFSGIDSSFFGNISQPVVTDGMFDPKMETAALAARIGESLETALASGRAEENVRLSQCSSNYSLPYFYFDASDMNCKNPGTIYINNQLKFKACELDWGTGLPAYVFPNELSDMVKFWQPVSGGPVQIIFGGLAAKTMSRR